MEGLGGWNYCFGINYAFYVCGKFGLEVEIKQCYPKYYTKYTVDVF